jgi:hypothetical protein
MGTDLKKAGQGNKIGVALFGVGSVVSFILTYWILGILLLGGAAYCFWGLMKDYARSGKRF